MHNTRHISDLNRLISFIIVSGEHVNIANLDHLSSYHVYSCALEEFRNIDKLFAKYDAKTKEWITSPQSDIKTPWVMLLEEEEFLAPKEELKLTGYLRQKNEDYAYVNVERLLPCDEIKKYAWITTHRSFANPSEDIRRYFTAELRIVPVSNLNKTDLFRHPDDCSERSCSFLVDSNDQNNSFTDICISRKSKIQPPGKIKAPHDHEIFRNGHRKYFDDVSYCSSFAWPRTTYSTLRFDHIPSVIQALKEGLSTPEIVIFTLIYLIRFRDFDMASEVGKWTPKRWLEKHPDLMNAIGAIHLASGRHGEAIKIFTQARELFPDLDIIATNTIKMHIIMGQYNMIEPIEDEYLKATGHPLDDDLIRHFKSVHKGLPKKALSVSLCMIIKNEAKYLERALKSVREMVNEIIVVDTGSTDDFVSITEKYGAKVFPLPWTDDFSAARNYAIEKASGDYIFMLDADEYISPLHFIESQLLIKFLSVDSPRAFKFAIGHYYNVSDWLFMLRSAGNFKLENASVRLFPNVSGVKYKGLIEESIEETLLERDIPIYFIPDESFHIIHDSEKRPERIMRKSHIYRKENKPNAAQILAAINDFSFIGDSVETLHWLWKYLDQCGMDDPKNLKMALHIANLLETMEPDKAESLYNEILIHYPQDYRILMNFASFLLRGNQVHKIELLYFQTPYESPELKGKDKLDYACFTSLKYFESGDIDKAFEILSTVLEESTAYPFAQSLKFYYLIRMNHIEGAIQTLTDLLHILSMPEDRKIDSIEDLLSVVEDLCMILLERGYFNERHIIINGTLSLEKLWQEK